MGHSEPRMHRKQRKMPITNIGPIFIVGNSRSGTTILSIGLGKHTDIQSFREIHFFERFWTSDWNEINHAESASLSIAEKLIGGQREGFLYCKNPEAYREEAQSLLDNIKGSENIKIEDIYSGFLFNETRNNGKSIPCEQTPNNVFYLKNILDFFPDARIIAMVRDPRDILLSQKKKSKITRGETKNIPLKERVRTWANYHPLIMSQMWNRVSVEIDKWSEDQRVTVIKFEDLTHNPKQSLRKICGFIGVDYQDSILEVPQIGSSNISDNTKKVGINKNVTGKWKKGLSSAEISICQKINKEKIQKYGYEWSNTKANPLSISLLIVSLPFKAGLALFLNLGRSKSILRSVMKRMIG